MLAYGIVADPDTVARHIAALAQTLPQSAAELIGEQLQRMTEGQNGGQTDSQIGASLVGAKR